MYHCSPGFSFFLFGPGVGIGGREEHCSIYVTVKVVNAYFGKVLFKSSVSSVNCAYSVFTEEDGLTLNFL